MKFCYKGDEPDSLRQYRTSYPNNRWEDFRQECPSGLIEVYKQLRRDQGGLCVYCEVEISERAESEGRRQVEHFHNKSDVSDTSDPMKWHLDWSNMWYACMGGTKQSDDPNVFMEPIKENQSCGQAKKADVIQEIFTPDDIPPFPRIFKYKQEANAVTIHPDEERCKEANIDAAKVQRTIDELGLNCPRLRQARLSVLKPLNKILKKRPDAQQKVRLASRFLGDVQRRNRSSFFTMIRFVLKDAAETYLRSIEYNG
jgi:uncharacterized protein (TIGR02646 family)